MNPDEGYTVEMRLLAPEPDTVLGDDVVAGLVGQQMTVGVDLVEIGPHAILPDLNPTAVITRAWVDDEGWVCAEVEVRWGIPGLDGGGPYSVSG